MRLNYQHLLYFWAVVRGGSLARASEESLDRLVADLASHDVDVVLSDAPATPSLNVRAYNHHLGDCGLVWMGLPSLVRPHRAAFPRGIAASR